MIHWGFLTLAFITGFALCYAIIYQVAKVYSRVMGAIEETAQSVRLQTDETENQGF